MADTKISALTQLTGTGTVADADECVIVDKSDTTMAASGTDKRITAADLAQSVGERLLMPEIAAPAAPAANKLQLYSVVDDGITRLEYVASNGERVRLARDQILTVRNNSGVTLNKGQAGYVSGANTTKTRVALAKADDDSTCPANGIFLDTIVNGGDGRLMLSGLIENVNTSAFSAGDRLFLSGATAGALTLTPPAVGPGFKQRVGFAVNIHASNGSILVAPAGLSPRQTAQGYLWPQEVPTVPTTPADGVVLFGRKIGGLMFPAYVGPSGLDSALQPLLARNKVGYWNPPGNAATLPGVFGFTAPTVTGFTATTRTVAVTNQLTRMRRLGYATVATAAAIGMWKTVNQFTLGGGTGLGGFTYIIRFGISDAATVAGARMFIGFGNAAGTPTNIEPSTQTGCIGVGHGAADTNLQIFYGGSVAQTPIDLGAGYPLTIGASAVAYELALTSPPGTTSVTWQVTNLNTGATTSGTITGAATVIPQETSLIGPLSWRTNNATALACSLDICSVYVGTDN